MEEIYVLIVEDDPKAADIYANYLKHMDGFSVCAIASSITEAEEALVLAKPDLVLLDIYFEESSGIDLLWHIRKEYRHVDVIMVTAAKEVAHVSEAIRGGAFDYILKPIILSRFQETLNKYRRYRQSLQGGELVNQKKVDELFRVAASEKPGSVQVKQRIEPSSMPKGIDYLTLKKVESYMEETGDEGKTAEEAASHLGMSRTTSRRYLEYLVSVNKVKAELSYGTVGRPERKYYWV